MDQQVTVRFVTKDIYERYRIGDSPLAIPRKLGRHGLSEVINHLLGLENALILGEFNAHRCLWNSSAESNKRGEELAAVIESSHYGALNEEPTRVNKNCMSSPGVTLVSDNLSMNTQWKIEL